MKYGIMYYKETDNIGDDFQTYAAKRFLKRIDYYIDREAMDSFIPETKEYVALIMNGWYMNNKLTWPPSPYIYPHLVSMHFTNAGLFNVGDLYIKDNVNKYLEKFDKVGCRDTETIKRLEKYGVKNCYFTGCLTLTLEKFQDVEKGDYICAVDVPDDVIEKIKASTSKDVKVITQNNYDLPKMSFEDRMKETERMLKIYQGASLVITRRLHAMFPSIALETPVILLKQNGYENEKDRFQDFLSYVGATFTIKEFLEMDISEIINNPKPNGKQYLDIRNNLIRSCEEFIKNCEELKFDLNKLPELNEYEKEVSKSNWNNEIGITLIENEKAKQREYEKKWEERETFFQNQDIYYKNQQKEYEKKWEEREVFFQNQDIYYKKQQKEYEKELEAREVYIKKLENDCNERYELIQKVNCENDNLKQENQRIKKEMEMIYNSKSWKMFETMRKIKNKVSKKC